jgi:hypothetical protein
MRSRRDPSLALRVCVSSSRAFATDPEPWCGEKQCSGEYDRLRRPRGLAYDRSVVSAIGASARRGPPDPARTPDRKVALGEGLSTSAGRGSPGPARKPDRKVSVLRRLFEIENTLLPEVGGEGIRTIVGTPSGSGYPHRARRPCEVAPLSRRLRKLTHRFVDEPARCQREVRRGIHFRRER